SPLYYIKTSEQLWHCCEKERALSSDAGGFEYDTHVRKVWSNKQCVGLPCLYQIVRMDGAPLTSTPPPTYWNFP
ncbi:putative disease resistance protein RGA4, partial [Clarias magur]